MKKNDESYFSEERTLLSNERTLLSYIRTFFSATILAILLLRFFADKIYQQLGAIILIIGLAFLFVGVYYYISRRRRLQIKK